MKSFAVYAALLAVVVADYECPGSSSFIHAKCQATAHLAEGCDVATAEIKARIAGAGGWVDPHNKGTYALVGDESGVITATHATGAAPHYVDKLSFVLSAEGAGCKVEACSESQVFSVLDFSTNYCNLRNLYCGSAENCPTAGHDLTVISEDTGLSCLQHDKSKCFIPARQ
eukprot:TRINITY_DN482_c1_g2_i1.p2 TRINITY_DN482_c1_g2~~TRINITY_DN482_c1_g2_i1.p2  ORF type:complete len:171 (+),score=59.24 TRINITY_DN482_c1_g2_i1:65-577(+)